MLFGHLLPLAQLWMHKYALMFEIWHSKTVDEYSGLLFRFCSDSNLKPVVCSLSNKTKQQINKQTKQNHTKQNKTTKNLKQNQTKPKENKTTQNQTKTKQKTKPNKNTQNKTKHRSTRSNTKICSLKSD